MDYCLGPGDGTAAMLSGRPDVDIDGDGEFDGVRMDFDGDGAFDDALADFDGDGLADHAALDLDDDGTAESLYTDDGSGTWAMTATGPPGPQVGEAWNFLKELRLDRGPLSHEDAVAELLAWWNAKDQPGV